MGRARGRMGGATALAIGLASCLACAPVRATAARVGEAPPAAALLRALDGEYTGFGAGARGGAGGPELVVRTLADAGAGSLREALAAAGAAGGGTIVFAVGGDIVLESSLEVPAHSTLDALSAPAPGITLWGERADAGRGVVNVLESDVIVRGLRIRNAANDGIHVAPKRGYAIRDVVIDHCSITNAADGGIDVTGHDGLTVTDVTLSWNYVAGCGSVCAKGTCGGGALVKYGVDRISVHGNLWDKNLRRNPTIDGGGVSGGSLADVRGNVVRQYEQSGIQIVAGARANVVGNVFDRAGAVYFPDGLVFMADNVNGGEGNVPLPYAVEALLAAVDAEDVMIGAGAIPRDAIDELYLTVFGEWAAVKAADVGPGAPPIDPAAPSPTATPRPAAGSPTPVWTPLGVPAALPTDDAVYRFPALPPNPIDEARLGAAVEARRAGDRARRHRAGAAEAAAHYGAAVRILEEATGPLRSPAHRVMARAEAGLAALGRRRPAYDLAPALQHARASVGHCALAGCAPAAQARARRSVRRLVRALVRRGEPPPLWTPPSY